jgi:signal transduction histidine kinase
MEIGGDVMAFADPDMLKSILMNLLTNASKFTPDNGEILLTSLRDNRKVVVCISDNGVGISNENQKKLFRLDEKISTPGTSNEKGTGLGLLLCKEFIGKNNGEIWVESQINQGTRFYFSLPVAKA